MSKTEKRKIGDLGEGIACNYLKKRGFAVIDRNYWKPWGEIDIIARKGDILHFIEVKTVTREKIDENVTRENNYRPEDNLHPWKLARLGRIIQTYLMSNVSRETNKEEINWRFDIICVYLNIKDKKAKVDFLEDIIL